MWNWLLSGIYDRRFVRRVFIKAGLLFVLLNIVYVLLNPLPWLSSVSLYNVLIPGRMRFPYSDDPTQTYSITLPRLEAMFASHTIHGTPKANDEYRVLMVGDSSVWGWLLDNDSTLSECINAGDYQTTDGRQLIAYNLGYPVLSGVKDGVIMEKGMAYEPDAVVWLITLQTLMDNEQLRHPILQDNADLTQQFLDNYAVNLDGSLLEHEDIFQKTLVGQRRELADLLRHQIYGFAWWATGFDHAPINYIGAPMLNLPQGERILNREDIEVGEVDFLVWDIVNVNIESVADVPVLLVNQPILISEGVNSDLRYNSYYPRWAYDGYRQELTRRAEIHQWHLLDLWDAVEPHQFTDSPFHYGAEATCYVASMIAPAIISIAD